MQTVVIVHSLAVSVEQLCARSPDSPSLEALRPPFCVCCGEPARAGPNKLRLVGHGMYSRQIRGLSETGWIVVWVRRFLCLACGHTVSRLPDWLHPWRWYAATVIVEALCRHYLWKESSRSVGVLFGRPPDATAWASLRRWRLQLLISPTLRGWLGPRLGAGKPAGSSQEIGLYLHRLLAEGRLYLGSSLEWVKEVPSAARRTLQDLVHYRKSAGSVRQFPPGPPSPGSSAPKRRVLPTEKSSGLDPPG